MSERGVFAVDRGVFDHPMFAREPFTEREAWLWLFGEAAYKAHRRRIGSAVVDLKRGQVAASLRFMAERWQWSEPKVRRFLKRLKTDAMIDAATDAGITVVTICNYNKFQRVSLPSDAPCDAPNDAEATQERRKGEDREYKEYTEANASEPAPPAAPSPVDARTELFRRGLSTLARITGKTPDSCRSLVGQWLKLAADEAIHVSAAIEDADRNRVVDPVPWIRRKLESLGRSRAPPRNRSFEEIADDLMRGSHAAVDDDDASAGSSRTLELDLGGGVSARR